MGRIDTRNKKITKIVFHLLLFTLLLNIETYGFSPNWYKKMRQVNLLEDTRFKVLKLFGSPKITYQGDLELEFRIKQGTIRIEYSPGRCSELSESDQEFEYDVEKDVVTHIEMYLGDGKDEKISKLGIDLSDFIKSEIHDLPGIYSYNNNQIGVYFAGSLTHMQEYSRYPSAEQNKLLCTNWKKEF